MFINIFIHLSAWPHWVLAGHVGSNSPTRDQTPGPCIGNVESYLPITREVPLVNLFFFYGGKISVTKDLSFQPL